MSRSKSFNFIDGAGIVTRGSHVVYLNLVIVLKNCHILASCPVNIFIKFLGYISFIFPWKKYYRISPASWSQIDCCHGNLAVFFLILEFSCWSKIMTLGAFSWWWKLHAVCYSWNYAGSKQNCSDLEANVRFQPLLISGFIAILRDPYFLSCSHFSPLLDTSEKSYLCLWHHRAFPLTHCSVS